MLRRFLSNQLREALVSKFASANIQVINDSHMHSRGTETHYRVVVVSDEFEGKSTLQRQRVVNEALEKFYKDGLHSVAVHAFTNSEYGGDVPKSPPCAGSKKSN